MKDYATETDIITTPDPLFYPGDKVEWGRNHWFVESVSWYSLETSWAYTLVNFLTDTQVSCPCWSEDAEDVLEKDLKLVSRVVAKQAKIQVY